MIIICIVPFKCLKYFKIVQFRADEYIRSWFLWFLFKCFKYFNLKSISIDDYNLHRYLWISMDAYNLKSMIIYVYNLNGSF